MYEDAANLPDGATLSCDICIIGAGAAGITLAHELIGSGKTVIVLEGSRRDERHPLPPGEMAALARTGTHLETRAAGSDICARHRFCDRLAQTLYEGSVSAEMRAIDPTFLTRSRTRVYGGTTNCWGGWTRPLTAADFDRSDLDPRMVWPFCRGDLDPFYAIAQNYCSLPPFDPSLYDDPSWWPQQTTTPVEVLPAFDMQSAVWTVMNGMGPGCDGALDFQLVWGPKLMADPDTRLLRNANVRRIEARGGSVTHAACTSIDYRNEQPGTSFTVTAKQFVVAAGGIETVRLLLLSGLQDRAGTLGRNFMVHPLNRFAVRFSGRAASREVRTLYSPPGATMTDGPWPPTFFAALTPTGAALRAAGIGNFRAQVSFDCAGGGVVNLNWEQVPSPENRITLSPDPGHVDLFGDPHVHLEWRHGDADQHTVEEAGKMVIRELGKLRLLDAVAHRDLRPGEAGDHHMGATRMAASDAHGFVDPDSRVHHIDNLFIAGPSVFPTSGYANPTLTLIALAARLARHLRGPTSPVEPSRRPAAEPSRADHDH